MRHKSNNNKRIKKLIFIAACVFSLSVFSQKKEEVVQSFRPVILIGLPASQIDGDTYSGYKKLGYYFGIGINRQLSRIIDAEFDIVFVQKGVRANWALDSATRNSLNNHFSLIRLNYVEIPLAIRFHYKKFRWEGGSYFSYLIKNPPYDESEIGMIIDPNFKNTDIGFLIGMGYKWKPNLLVNLRFEYSYIPIRDYYPNTQGIFHGQFPRNLFNTGLYNNTVTFSLNYVIPPKATATTDPK
jgi:opacity protein-like surface antigen